MSAPAIYRGSITREHWLVRETRIVAQLRLDDGLADNAALLDRVFAENPFQYGTERELRSITLACARRLDALSEDPSLRNTLTALVAHGTPDQLKQANLYALMRDNRIVWDFMTGIVAQKFRALDGSLHKAEITGFLEGLRTQDERAARWSDSTLNKIRQVLTACLEQCGMYDRKTEELRPLLLDFDLEQAIRANDDACVLPSFGITG